MFTFDSSAGVPGIELAEISGLMLQFLFGMLRIGAFLLASPMFGSRFVPLQVRIVASVLLAVAVFTTVELPPAELLAQPTAITAAFVEMIIGLGGGLLLTILFGASAIAGDRIASTAGLGFAAQMDPVAGGQSPVVSTIFSLFLVAVFLSADGHLVAIRIMIESYEVLPIGSGVDMTQLVDNGLRAASQMFVMAVRLMLPVVSVLLIVNIVIGVITRSAPQMNIFSFGFPLTMLTAMTLLFLGAPTLAVALQGVVDVSLEALGAMIRAVSNG